MTIELKERAEGREIVHGIIVKVHSVKVDESERRERRTRILRAILMCDDI